MNWCRSSLAIKLLASVAILTGAGCLVNPPSTGASPSTSSDQEPHEDILSVSRKQGPWAVRSLKESDGIRNGPDYDRATIFYPVDESGALPSDKQLAIMAFCPGYRGSQRSMAAWGKFMASHGVATITLGTNRLSDYPPERGRALLDAIVTIRKENERDGSPLQGKLAVDKAGVAGWSMGGGGAQHAAVADSSLKAVVAMLPWEPGHAFEHAVPVFILAGEQDRIASARRNARPHYDQTPSGTIKSYYEIKNGDHFVINRPSNLNGDVGAWVLAWVKTYVEGDVAYKAILDQKPSSAGRYERSPK
ncbi:MAG: triacylglycerol lipase [Phycisphaerae bacterium]|nr:triacylglycerol lipase [Phycisphaerae bacterium]